MTFRAWTTEERERWCATGETPNSGHLGMVPLAPRRRPPASALVSTAAGLGAVLVAVLVALGVVHLIQLLGGGR